MDYPVMAQGAGFAFHEIREEGISSCGQTGLDVGQTTAGKEYLTTFYAKQEASLLGGSRKTNDGLSRKKRGEKKSGEMHCGHHVNCLAGIRVSFRNFWQIVGKRV